MVEIFVVKMRIGFYSVENIKTNINKFLIFLHSYFSDKNVKIWMPGPEVGMDQCSDE